MKIVLEWIKYAYKMRKVQNISAIYLIYPYLAQKRCI